MTVPLEHLADEKQNRGKGMHGATRTTWNDGDEVFHATRNHNHLTYSGACVLAQGQEEPTPIIGLDFEALNCGV